MLIEILLGLLFVTLQFRLLLAFRFWKRLHNSIPVTAGGYSYWDAISELEHIGPVRMAFSFRRFRIKSWLTPYSPLFFYAIYAGIKF